MSKPRKFGRGIEKRSIDGMIADKSTKGEGVPSDSAPISSERIQPASASASASSKGEGVQSASTSSEGIQPLSTRHCTNCNAVNTHAVGSGNLQRCSSCTVAFLWEEAQPPADMGGRLDGPTESPPEPPASTSEVNQPTSSAVRTNSSAKGKEPAQPNHVRSSDGLNAAKHRPSAKPRAKRKVQHIAPGDQMNPRLTGIVTDQPSSYINMSYMSAEAHAALVKTIQQSLKESHDRDEAHYGAARRKAREMENRSTWEVCKWRCQFKPCWEESQGCFYVSPPMLDYDGNPIPHGPDGGHEDGCCETCGCRACCCRFGCRHMGGEGCCEGCGCVKCCGWEHGCWNLCDCCFADGAYVTRGWRAFRPIFC
ncbi:hypothetical protein EJ02DRAFT_265307 [Clathrospora elynae]|uniref:Uncharacterized protein n=1 Tax=Clathrospora elynae TaxID=706981 RepID=A0A6A5SH19_9PLEO|nr:hypothetical protein EJ02DRAFT_265307 [Clathrospora elynae]